MGVGIYGQPNDYGFGLEFDYTLWTEGTVIDLVNVPFNNDYRDVVRFADRAALNAYIDARKPTGLSFSGVSHVKPYQPVKLPISHNRSVKYNYMRVHNPLIPVESGDVVKYYYYFILDTEYVAPEVTNFVLQLDVWQTFVYDIQLGNCFVERGHIGIANSNGFNNYGRDYLTIPEGIDTGTDYQVIMQRKRWIMDPMIAESGSTTGRFQSHDLLVFSATDLIADAGTKENPNLDTPGGTIFQGTTHGAGIYVFDPQSFLAYMNSMSDKPWVTQGILSITMIPKITRYHPDFEYAQFPQPSDATTLPPSDLAHQFQTNWRDHTDISGNIPERYRHLKKFWTFPYMAIELTTFMGTPLMLKPEVWNSAHADVKERANLVPPAQRIEFYPSFYNSKISSYADAEEVWPFPITGYMAGIRGDDYGDYVDIVTQIGNFPTMAIVNNGAIGYLAANMHGIAYQYGATDWAQQRALGLNQQQYDVATGAMHTAMDVAGSAMNADIANTAAANTLLGKQALIDAAQSMTGGAALSGGGNGGMIGAGMSAALFGAMNKGVQAMANDEMLAIRQTAAGETLTSQNKQQQLVRDTNKQVADWAARGDYSNSRAAIDAKVNDAQLIQPTTSGQIGGETMALVMGGWQVSARWKMIDQARIKMIGEYWLRYGYAVHHEMIPPQSLQVMSKFTYWKMSETYIASSTVPEGFKQALRGILEKGVTVWADPNDIGLIDWADNTALAGVSY